MSQEVFKVPKTKRPQPAKRDQQGGKSWSPIKRRRTKDDFFSFCQIVLDYTGYESIKTAELRLHNNTSPLDSGGSAAESFTSDSSLGSWGVDAEEDRRMEFTPKAANKFSAQRPNKLKHKMEGKRQRSHITTKVIITDSSSPKDTPVSPPSDRSGSLSPPGSICNGPTGMSDEDSFELITCYCLKPFAGRPMIECAECLTWVHLSCAKIRRTNIPDDFICSRCKENKFTTRKSGRVRLEKRPSTP